MLYSPQVRISSTGRAHADNSRKAALLQSTETREQAVMLTAEDLAYASFTYNPRFPALEQKAREEAWVPEFPATTGRIAYCNGRFIHEADTSVTYRRGHRVVTEWHALACVAA